MAQSAVRPAGSLGGSRRARRRGHLEPVWPYGVIGDSTVVNGDNTANGTQLDLWTCNGGTNQHWSIP